MGRRQPGKGNSNSKSMTLRDRVGRNTRTTRSSASSNGTHGALNDTTDCSATNFDSLNVKREDDITGSENADEDDISDFDNNRSYKKVKHNIVDGDLDSTPDQSDVATVGYHNTSEHDDDEDEDDESWEEVSVHVQRADVDDEDEQEEDISGPWMYNPVEIVFDKPLQEIKKSAGRGITKEERMIRVLIHQVHILCLIANGQIRNRWINHDKLKAVALSIVPEHIASSVQESHSNTVQEINVLQVLALWWKDSFVVTGPGIQNKEFQDPEVVGYDAIIPDVNMDDIITNRKDLQRRLLRRHGCSDVCAQLFTAICRALGLKARLVESLQPCSFKISQTKEASEGTSSATSSSRKRKKKEQVLDESDTTRGSRVVIPTPHRKLKRPATNVPMSHKQADGYLMDVTRRYTRQWGSVTRKLRVQPFGPSKFDWWEYTLSLLKRPYHTKEDEEEMAELLQSEMSEQMPTRIADFNNHPLYALERHLKRFEVLHPKKPVLGHIRGEAIYPRSCVKLVRSKEQWLKRAREIKPDEQIPAKWVKARPATILQMRLQQQKALSGEGEARASNAISREGSPSSSMDLDDALTLASSDGDQVALWGEWQTEPYKPPVVVDGVVPRNQYGRLDVFTPAMVPIGGVHLRGRNIAKIARQLGVDYVEAVTGFDFQSRRSVPVIDGIVVPAESSELVMDAFHEVSQHADAEARKKQQAEVLKRWRKFVMGALVRARLLQEYGDPSAKTTMLSSSISKDGIFDPEKESKWEPKLVESDEAEDSDAAEEAADGHLSRDQVHNGQLKRSTRLLPANSNMVDRKGKGKKIEEDDHFADSSTGADSGAGFMFD
ncbi:hypothetical protein BGW42_000467 [Actinomortierella wolfii]|nr:hypothetical protein BGW42_000467 [Actinomortierella wolfii]